MPEEPEITEEETSEEVESQQEESKPFDGDFDADRARKTIDRLRSEVKAQKEKTAAAENKTDPEKDQLAKEVQKLRIAIKIGLPESLASRIQGANDEELIEDAQSLLDLIKPASNPVVNQPKPKLSGGSDPTTEPEISAHDIAAKIQI